MDVTSSIAGQEGTVLVVEAPEAINHETAEPIKEAVRRSLPDCDNPGLVLDMAGVEAVNSIGITALLELLELIGERSGTLLLARVPDRQVEFLRMLHLDRKFRMYPAVEEAVAALDQR